VKLVEERARILEGEREHHAHVEERPATDLDRPREDGQLRGLDHLHGVTSI
jgi:hypothetical protein